MLDGKEYSPWTWCSKLLAAFIDKAKCYIAGQRLMEVHTIYSDLVNVPLFR